jgi:hypothetical protein
VKLFPETRAILPFTHEEMACILAALDPFYDQITPSGKDSARRLRALAPLLTYRDRRIGDAVRLTTDRVTGNKLFL